MSSGVPLLLILPFVGSVITLLGKLVRWKRTLSVVALCSLAGVGVILAVLAKPVLGGETLVYHVGGWLEPYGIALYLDGVAWLSLVLIVVVSGLVGVAALSRPTYDPTFFFFLLLLFAGMEGVVLTGDLFNMFVSFEIVAMSAYVLIAYDRNPAGLLASFKYLILSSVGMLFFLFGVLLIYRDFGTLSLRELSVLIGDSPGSGDTTAIHLAIAALCVGIGVRTAFLPFHTWLPEAHAHAPHPVSALLSGVLIKISFFAIIRILAAFSAAYLNTLLMWIGAVTAVFAVLRALSQTDAKRLLAYHSISQMGYILAVFGAGGALATAAAFYHAINHALFKCLLFLAVGAAIRMTGKRDLMEMEKLGRRAPILAIAYFVGALSIAGIPPFNGFSSKLLISYSMEGNIAYWLIRLAAVGTVASFIKLSRIFLPGPSTATAPRSLTAAPLPADRPGFLIHVPVVLLGGLCVVTGLFPGRVVLLIQRLVAEGAAAGLPAFFSAGKLLESFVVTALGVALYLLIMTPPAKRLAKRVRDVAPELRTVLIMFLLGLAGFALVAYV